MDKESTGLTSNRCSFHGRRGGPGECEDSEGPTGPPKETEALTIEVGCPPLPSRTRTSLKRARGEVASCSQLPDGGPGVGMRERQGSSCQALRHAVLKLYRMDDFSMEKIGEGFFSEVYKVVHKTNEEVMVLKLNVNEENRPNMLREAQLMNKMSHPNILKFLGVCVHQGQLHALTEFVNGGDLHKVVTDNDDPLPWRVRVNLCKDIASGMQYLHHTGYIHRDLTSRNVLVKMDNQRRMTAIVSDFGLVAKIPDSSQSEFHLSVAGSPYWMSPECITGNRYYEKADVFSFGIMQCEVIARIDAHPDILPRTNDFGLDYVAFAEMSAECPLHFLHHVFTCCQIDPDRRPSMEESVSRLTDILSHRLLDEDLEEEDEEEEEYRSTAMGPAFPLTPRGTASDARFAFGTKGHKRSRSLGEYDWLVEPSTPATSPRKDSKRLNSACGGAPSDPSDPSQDQGTGAHAMMGLRMLQQDSRYKPPTPPLGAVSLATTGSPITATGQVSAEGDQTAGEIAAVTASADAQHPFSVVSRFRDGRKLLASSTETAHYYSQLRHWRQLQQKGTAAPMGPGLLVPRGASVGMSGVSSPTSHLMVDPFSACSTPLQSPRHTFSLPDSPGLVQQAICQLNARIVAAEASRNQARAAPTTMAASNYILLGSVGSASSCTLDEPFDDSSSVDSAVVLETRGASLGRAGRGRSTTLQPSYTGEMTPKASAGARRRRRSFSTRQHKQLSLEYAMLFCGIELIQSQRKVADDLARMRQTAPPDKEQKLAEAAEWIQSCKQESTDLELQFKDDLEDVLRSCSSSESYLSTDDLAANSCGAALSPPAAIFVSSPREVESEAGSDLGSQGQGGVGDPCGSSGRFISRTLVEKRRSLRRVEPRNKEKMDELQHKLENLRLIDKKMKAESKRSRRILVRY